MVFKSALGGSLLGLPKGSQRELLGNLYKVCVGGQCQVLSLKEACIGSNRKEGRIGTDVPSPLSLTPPCRYTARGRAIAALMKTLNVGNCLVEDGMIVEAPA